MIYDTFMFSNEVELLELRLRELNDIVDKFVLVESIKTFRGYPKKLYYQENIDKFKDYANKIINIAIDISVPNDIENNSNPDITSPKYREYTQRNAISIGLQNCNDNDIIMLSDIDEIPNKNIIKKLIANQEIGNDSIICLNMRLFFYYINCWMEHLELWGGTTISRHGLFKTKGPQWMRDNGYKYTIIKNENAGWHFTYLNFNPRRIIDKIVTMTSDPEVNIEKYSKKEWVESCIKNFKDIYGRDHKLKIIDLDDTFPETILKNPEKYPIYTMKNDNINNIKIDYMKNDISNKKKLFISADLNTGTSGDIVASKELEAMYQLAGKENVIVLDHKDIHPTQYGFPDNPFIQDCLTLERVSKIDLTNVDLVHIYSTPYPQTIKYLKSKNIETTITCAAHDRKETIQEFENLGYQYPYKHIKDDNLWKIYSKDIREADIVITPSKSSETFLITEGAKEVKMIPHGCHIPDDNNIKPFPKQFTCGYMGAIGPDKGLIYLIRAWSLLNYDDSILIFAGNQSHQLEQYIQKYATGGKYHIAGFVPNVEDFYNSISVYIQPSVTEGFGMEVIEAMSFARPVIVSSGAGAADAITNGEDGFIIDKRNPEAIAEKIDWLKNNPDKLIEMSKSARKRSLEYDWKIVKDMYIKTWKNLLNN